MTRLILSQLQHAKAQSNLPWRELCESVPYSTVMRWRARVHRGQALLQSPGPKKTAPLDWQQIYREVLQLDHGRARTQGTTSVYARYAQSISRRQVRQLAAQIRQNKNDSMTRIHWHFPGLAWGIDATEYKGSWKLIPVSDLACRYRFVPLVALCEDGDQIALYLETLFRQHGPPLFLKRDNGSPFNCQAVERVLERHCVLPLNSPPRYPRYNGAMEKSIGDLKRHLDQRLHAAPGLGTPLLAQVETAVHALNHQPRRRFKGRTPCDLFHDPNRRLSLSLKARKRIFRLLLTQFAQTIGKMAPRNHREYSAAWRLSVETWLRCQGLISVRPNSKPNVSTIFPKIWSHN
jgi:transposase InsO family protein